MAKHHSRPSLTTQLNWWLDASVFLGAVISMITGIYFLYLPVGGYQGGRNPTYGITILFERHTWDDLHTWGGVLMIAAVALHLWIHRSWIGMMTRKAFSTVRGQGGSLSKGARVNVLVDAIIAVGFLLSAISGIFFLFEPAEGVFIFTRTTWDLIHTWASIALALAAMAHIYIHWLWVTKVSAKMFRAASQPRQRLIRAALIPPLSNHLAKSATI